jgi:hypothetical protein
MITTRASLIERILRTVYNGQPSEDSSITKNLVNVWLNDAIATAAKTNYADNLKLDGIAYVNNSFYTTFKQLAIEKDNLIENFTYKITLPQIPLGIGKNGSIAEVRFLDASGISFTGIPLSINQNAYQDGMRPIPNKIFYIPESNFIYCKTTLPLFLYTANVKMISGGDASDLTSTINIPDDYMPVIIQYVSNMLFTEKKQPQDLANDGEDIN